MAQLANTPVVFPSRDNHAPEAGKKALKLLVIGATRGAGREVARQGVAAGHAVTALARDPARVEVSHERLTVLRGDVLDPATLAPAMAGCDAVVSSLGVTSSFRAPTTLYSAGMQNIIQAMRAVGVTRLIAVTAAPLGPNEGTTLPGRLVNKLMWAFINEVYSDMARMEDEMSKSGLAWTIVRPPRLTNKPAIGRYRTEVNRSVRGGYSIARADLAGALLKLLDDPASIQAAISIAY